MSELYLMTDADLITALLSSGGKSADLMRSVMNRRLYKKCLTVYSIDADDDFKASLVRFSTPDGRRQLEEEIASSAGVDPRDVIADIPSESALLSKVRIGKTDVSIIDSEDRVRSITKYSSVAKALQSRGAIDWAVMISAPEKDQEAVRRAAVRTLSFDDTDRA
jgi:HD superfamily phosphohydrolase